MMFFTTDFKALYKVQLYFEKYIKCKQISLRIYIQNLIHILYYIFIKKKSIVFLITILKIIFKLFDS